MFKKTLRLLEQNQPPQKIVDNFTPNSHLFDKFKVFEVKADYLPRQKINPFRKRPLRVIYDHNDFMSFVMPSRRGSVFKGWSHEELFGVKRWRNDSAFIKEYMRVDNQLCMIVFIGLLLLIPGYINFHREVLEAMDGVLTANLGNYSSDDLI
jgi:hypothetical protein